MSDAAFTATLTAILDRTIDPPAVRAAFEQILAGGWTPIQVGAFAIALRQHGEDAEMIVAAAEALRAAMASVDHDLDRVVDTCGTGGDGAHTLNVSTAAAIVVAGAGLAVAKHGNRSVSSSCGSADVIEALGIPLAIPLGDQRDVLREAGIAFLMAPLHHPALRHAATARRELGVRTIFNALGPIVNPARATHQVIGVYDDALRPMIARALAKLGIVRAWVVRSEDGLDEVSPAAATRVSVVANGEVAERVVTPEDFGVTPSSLERIRGGDAKENARAIEVIVRGENHPARDAIVLNAAAAIHVADDVPLLDATKRARDAIDSGRAFATLERWREIARSKVAR